MPVTSNVTKGNPTWRARGVCLTSYRETDWEQLPVGVQYLAWGDETCPTTGRPHKQAFAYSQTPQRFSWWKANFPKDHIEQMRGNFRENEKYITKEGTLRELGERPMLNGDHRAKHAIVARIENGERPMTIARENGELTETIARYHRFWTIMYREITMEKLRSQGFKPRQVFIHVGAAGVGKSRLIYNEHKFSDIYVMPRRDGKWFGSYSGQPVVVFNDVRAGDIMSIPDFLNVTDGYPIEVEVKGDFVPWCAEYIYFTSNDTFDLWWPYSSDENRAAVKRRVTEMRVFKADGSMTFE